MIRHRSSGVVVLEGEAAAFMAAGIVTQPFIIYVCKAMLIGAALWNALALRRS